MRENIEEEKIRHKKKMLGEKHKSHPQDPSTSYGKND